jgi:hypothetical protein
VDLKAVETVFHAANERLRARIEELSLDGFIPFICECSDPNCFTVVELSRGEYEQTADQADTFVLAPGHADLSIESVVAQTERFEVVRKTA